MVEDRARENGMIYKRLVSGMIGAIPTGYKARPEEWRHLRLCCVPMPLHTRLEKRSVWQRNVRLSSEPGSFCQGVNRFNWICPRECSKRRVESLESDDDRI